MGQKITYCFKCGSRIVEEELRKGKAIFKWNKFICSVCVKEMGLLDSSTPPMKSVPAPGPPEHRQRRPGVT